MSSYRVDRPGFGVVSGSGTVSSYAVRGNGELTLLAAVAGTTGAGPAELTLGPDSRSLHVRDRLGALTSFAVGTDGSLSALGVAQGAPTFGTSGRTTDRGG